MTEPLRTAELTELARLFPPGRSATETVLIASGFSVAMLPVNAANAWEFWTLINTAIGAGEVHDGRRRVITAALQRYPYNPTLRLAAGPGSWRLLVVGTSPTGLGAIRADRELRRLRELGGPMVVHDCPAATVADLALIRTERPDVLHLACHGRGEQLLFDDGGSGVHGVAAAAVAQTLAVYRETLGVGLRGIVLNACTSELAGARLRGCADVVLAHRDDLHDDDGVAFAEALYRVLPDTDGLAAAARIAAAELVQRDATYRRLERGLVILGGDAAR